MKEVDARLLVLYLARRRLVEPLLSFTLSAKLRRGVLALVTPRRPLRGEQFLRCYVGPMAASTPTTLRRQGAGAYDTVRPLAYQDAQVFLLCFSVADPSSLDNAINKWHGEVRAHCGNTAVILCGCQVDLRTDKGILAELSTTFHSPITPEQGVTASRQIGATTYVETSARSSSKVVTDAFEVAALAALGKLNKERKLYCGEARSRSKVDLKAELKDRARSCALM